MTASLILLVKVLMAKLIRITEALNLNVRHTQVNLSCLLAMATAVALRIAAVAMYINTSWAMSGNLSMSSM